MRELMMQTSSNMKTIQNIIVSLSSVFICVSEVKSIIHVLYVKLYMCTVVVSD